MRRAAASPALWAWVVAMIWASACAAPTESAAPQAPPAPPAPLAPPPPPGNATFAPPSGSASAPADGLFILSPAAARSGTAREQAHVLGRTVAGARVRVGGEPVTVYATGVFARDGVPLALGANSVQVQATLPDGRVLAQTLEIERLPVPPPLASAAPPAASAYTLPPNQADAAGALRSLVPLTPPQMFVAGAQGVQLLHGLHEVRLGGPFVAELPAGTLLWVTGRAGGDGNGVSSSAAPPGHYRIQLASDTSAWAAAASISPAPAGTQRPHAAFTSLSVAGNDQGDVLTIPVPPHLPYAVRAVNSAEDATQIEIDLYGAHRATTWITHKASAKLVREVSVQQPADGRVRVLVQLRDKRLWGWRIERVGAGLQLTVRAPPPALQARAEAAAGAVPITPLAGLHIALEPGHGGPSNLGAVGATGVPEKDINRWAVDALQAELESAGARISVVRQGDDNPTLAERTAQANASGADLYLSVHANAADTARGVFRARGVSTYYHHGHARDLAASIQRQQLASSGLDDFGLIGAFNYAPIRWLTWMPAVLVEQAFVTHPGDEAALLDAEARARSAAAIRRGIEDWLRRR